MSEIFKVLISIIISVITLFPSGKKEKHSIELVYFKHDTIQVGTEKRERHITRLKCGNDSVDIVYYFHFHDSLKVFSIERRYKK